MPEDEVIPPDEEDLAIPGDMVGSRSRNGHCASVFLRFFFGLF